MQVNIKKEYYLQIATLRLRLNEKSKYIAAVLYEKYMLCYVVSDGYLLGLHTLSQCYY